jgi:pyruvate/2-oxoglutarate dehydrogenase complex dihydrolipoamide dehydrogenase (E3) component
MPGADTERERFDAIIIGVGQAAKPLALALGAAGWRTAVIERQHVGGSCINFGCTPTKTLAASARVAHLARRAADYGIRAGAVEVDMAAVRQRKRAIVERFREGVRTALEGAANVELIMGHGRFAGPHEVDVDLKDGGSRALAAERVFIHTGTRTFRPPIPGLERVPVLDAGTVMELERVPEHLAVIGGGYAGLEFAQMFRRFGSQVSIVERGPQLLGREDADVAGAVREILAQDGIEVHLDSEVAAARPGREGGVVLDLRSPAGVRQLVASDVLLAAGRTPNADDLNLAAAGVGTDQRGYILVNERLETGVPGVYAMGDVKGGPAFTHISYDDYRVLKANLLEGGAANTIDRMEPYTVFIDPQLGRIGMTEAQVRQSGRRYLVARLPMSWVARAIETGETRGFMKAVLDADTERILGCAVLGIEGGELMALLQVAMMGGITYPRLRDAIFAHPTGAESLNTLFAAPEPGPSGD